MARHYIQINNIISVYETESEKTVQELWQDVKTAAQSDPEFEGATIENIPERYWEQAGLHKVKTFEPHIWENDFIEGTAAKELGISIATCAHCTHCENSFCSHYGGSCDVGDAAVDCSHFYSEDDDVHELYYQDALLTICVLTGEELPPAYAAYQAFKAYVEEIEKPEDMSEETFQHLFYYDEDDEWEEWLERDEKEKENNLVH